MATLLLLLAIWSGRVDSPYDTYAVCLLIALDASTALRWVIWRQGRG